MEGSSSLPGACVAVGGGADRRMRKVDGRRRKLPNEVVFATANITSADPAGRLGARAVGTNCTGRMAELELLFDKAGFDVVSVQEGRMPQCTVLQGDVFTMYLDKGVGATHSLGNQIWVRRSLSGAVGSVKSVRNRIMYANMMVGISGRRVRARVFSVHAPTQAVRDEVAHDELFPL